MMKVSWLLPQMTSMQLHDLLCKFSHFMFYRPDEVDIDELQYTDKESKSHQDSNNGKKDSKLSHKRAGFSVKKNWASTPVELEDDDVYVASTFLSSQSSYLLVQYRNHSSTYTVSCQSCWWEETCLSRWI
jgi:hypothetical protein